MNHAEAAATAVQRFLERRRQPKPDLVAESRTAAGAGGEASAVMQAAEFFGRGRVRASEWADPGGLDPVVFGPYGGTPPPQEEP